MAEEIIGEFGEHLESITLLRGGKGQFEVSVQGRLLFSKTELKRHATQGEVVELVRSAFPAVGATPASARDLRLDAH